MMKQIGRFLLAFLVSTTIIFASDVDSVSDSKVIEAKIASGEYLDYLSKIERIIQKTNGQLTASSEEASHLLPKDTFEAYVLFNKVCSPEETNSRLNKKIIITSDNQLTRAEFLCDIPIDYVGNIETMQFVATVNESDDLLDLQINHLAVKGMNSPMNFMAPVMDRRNFNLRDGAEVVIAVSASTLVSGLLANQIYPGQGDKIAHAAAGSLIAAGATLVSYYGLKLTKNQSAIVGFVAAIAAGLLKEYVYDANNPSTHTVDARDAFATGMGGGFGAFFIRLKFRF